MNLGALWEAKPHFLHTFCWEEYEHIYRVLSQCFGRKWSIFIAERPCFLATQTLGIRCPCTNLPWHVGKAEFEKVPTLVRSAKEVGPAGPTLARSGPGFVPHHSLVSYSLWLCLILDIMKICMDFGPYDAFPSSDVPEMVDQQNSWNSLVINTYLLYLEWNVGMLAVNICILWPPTPPHTLRVLLVPEQKKRIKSWGHK
jgi:hypothetical protein